MKIVGRPLYYTAECIGLLMDMLPVFTSDARCNIRAEQSRTVK